MVEQALLVARVGFVILLYLFVWRVVRLSARDIRAPQESMILSAEAARAAGLGSATPPAGAAPRLVVRESPVFPTGTIVLIEDTVTIGRGPDNDVVLDGDETASAHHARIFLRGGTAYVDDAGSTNGTYVNGKRLIAEQPLRVDDSVAIGRTTLHYQAAPR